MKNGCRNSWLAAWAIVALATVGLATAAEDVAPSTGGPFGDPALGPPPCICGFDPVGDAFCSTDSFCDGLEACDENVDCPDGFKCLVDNCCPAPLGTGACVPVCDDVLCINPGVCGTFDDCEEPLFVELESFEGRWSEGVVTLSWTTATEVENAGFRILRARRDGSRVRKSASGARELEVSLELVTQRLIPAQGDPLEGASYRYTDGAPHRPGVVSYYLVDVDYSGVATLHGPANVEVPERGDEDNEAPDRGGRSR